VKLSITKIALLVVVLFSIIGCASKQPIISKSATILFKTPNMKFYDRGFVTKYDNYIDLQIFNAGTMVLKLLIYEDEVCKNSFKCMSSKEFNKLYLSEDYSSDFLYKLFSKDKISFNDRANHIKIKVF